MPWIQQSVLFHHLRSEREFVVAFVVLNPGHDPSEALARDLQTHTRERLSAHAYPREVVFVDDLPKTPSGKIQRFVLRQKAK